MGQLSKKAEATKQCRERRKQAGKCIDCGINDAVPGISRCQSCREKHKLRPRPNERKLKDEVFAAYGGYICACCGESHSHEFMCIDHVNGDGHLHKHNGKRILGANMYRWLRNNNYPAGFQVMCHNCNLAKRTGKECPHKAQRQGMLKKLAAIPLEY